MFCVWSGCSRRPFRIWPGKPAAIVDRLAASVPGLEGLRVVLDAVAGGEFVNGEVLETTAATAELAKLARAAAAFARFTAMLAAREVALLQRELASERPGAALYAMEPEAFAA